MIKKYLTLILLILVMVLFDVIPANASSAFNASKYAWVDESGNIIFQTIDKVRSGTKAYKTLGITVTRCILGTKVISPAYETVAIAFNTSSASLISSDNGITRTLFKFPESELLSRIAACYGDTDWLADLQCESEQPVYLVLNSIMVCVEYDSAGVAHQQGFYYDDGSRLGRWAGNVYASDAECRCSKCGGNVPQFKDGFYYLSSGTQSPLICWSDDCYAHQMGGAQNE